jgi:uncharacterized membrane protein YjjP (DUF1212 family)
MQHEMPFEWIAVIAAAAAALVFGLLAMLSWQDCLMIVLAAAAIAGGAVFTVVEMRSLGKES